MKRFFFPLLLLFALLIACRTSDSGEQAATEAQTKSDSLQISWIPKEEQLKRSKDNLRRVQVADSLQAIEDSLQAAANRIQKDSQLQVIQTEYYRINHLLPRLESVDFEVENDHYGTGYSAWKEGEEWVKIRENPYNDHGIFYTEYSFKDGEIYFIYGYSEYIPMVEEPSSIVRENRYYLADGEIIQLLTREKSFPFQARIDMSEVPQEEGSIEEGIYSVVEIQETTKRLLAIMEEHGGQD